MIPRTRNRMRMAAAAATLALALATPALRAQVPAASLVADRIEIAADGALRATGSVEVLYEGARLTATQVTYDPRGERLRITGPLVLSADGASYILASEAELAADLRDGLLRSARLVLDRQLQIAADTVAQGARFTRLERVTASSCTICERGETPLWEIRARRVIRDGEALQLYFEDAQVRALGVPIFYAPRLRLPDPTLDRATGFLVPELRSRTNLGTGIAVPYFVRLGDHADVTLTPYVTGATITVEGRYRQELSFGRIDVTGAASEDDLVDGARGYVFAGGRFDLPRDYTLRFDLQLASDPTYLLDYGYSDADRLESGLSLERVRTYRRLEAAASSFQTLRAVDEQADRERPDRLVALTFDERLWHAPGLGQVWLGLSGAAVERPSDAAQAGRDVARLSGELSWEAERMFAGGIVADATARLSHDRYVVRQDPRFANRPGRTTPALALTAALPLERTGPDGARHLLEPVVQLAWSQTRGDAVPNEDSTVVEFDESNLFSLNRFPGKDRREEGFRVHAGLSWTRHDPDGWSVAATAGRIFRFDGFAQFDPSTGLAGSSSDWLVALHYDLGGRLSAASRSLVSDSAAVVRSETRLAYTAAGYGLSGTHLWRAADPTEGRPSDLSEVTLDGNWRIGDAWATTGFWRFDAEAADTTLAGVGVEWANECLGAGLSLSRRFTSSTTIEPATEVDFRIFLRGFGADGDPRAPRRRCGG